MHKRCLVVILFSSLALIVFLFASNLFVPQNVDQQSLPDENLKSTAVLIDSLCVSVPDQNFRTQIVEKLVQAGFCVDVYCGKNVTVDFLSGLDENYDLVILRMHSAVHSETLGLYLFTGESYCENKYLDAQYSRMVKKAYAFDYSEPVFAVNWMFVKTCMNEKFCNTTVIVMGCDGTCDLKMSTAFFNQGATAYIGWNGLILPSHSSVATLQLVENLYLNNFSVHEAVEKTNTQVGPDPTYQSTLQLFTPQLKT